MKPLLRHLRAFTLGLIVIGASNITTTSSPALDRIVPPECVTTCTAVLVECFFAGGKNNEHDNACFSEYRKCIAQCGKH